MNHLATLGVGVGTMTSAHAATSGYVTCRDQRAVVGVGVTVSGGRSGWAAASSSKTPGYSTGWSNVSCYPGWIWGSASYAIHDTCR